MKWFKQMMSEDGSVSMTRFIKCLIKKHSK